MDVVVKKIKKQNKTVLHGRSIFLETQSECIFGRLFVRINLKLIKIRTVVKEEVTVYKSCAWYAQKS